MAASGTVDGSFVRENFARISARLSKRFREFFVQVINPKLFVFGLFPIVDSTCHPRQVVEPHLGRSYSCLVLGLAPSETIATIAASIGCFAKPLALLLEQKRLSASLRRQVSLSQASSGRCFAPCCVDHVGEGDY
jgi:hypothetical protein